MKHIAITKQEINGAEVNSVLARDLYDSLGFDKSQFSRWAKKNIIDNGYALAGKDYVTIDTMSNGRDIKDYILCIDFATKLAMMARSKEGEDVRDYFVKIEKQLKKESHLQLDIQLERLDALTKIAHKTNSILNQHTDDIREVKDYIEEEKRTRPVTFSQQKILLDTKNRRVYEIADGDKAIVKSAHHKMWSLFKRKFQIPRYSELPTYRFNDGVDYLKNLTIADLIA